MLPNMRGKVASRIPGNPRITIVGAGNLAHALAESLHKAGYVIDQIVSRARPASLRRAKRLAAKLGTSAVTISKAQVHAEVVWFCVPDGAIAAAAKTLKPAADWAKRIALHSSGALTGDELSALRSLGASVASVHPFMTFVGRSQPLLAGVPVAIEGDAAAVLAARRIVKSLGSKAYSIRPEDKSAYHAWGTFVSPLLVALLVTSEHVAAETGLTRNISRRKMLPILKQTLANYEAFGAAPAFSGPLVRGDADTVVRHLKTLRGVDRAVYLALAHAALAYLPTKNKTKIKTALRSFESARSRN
jgi:predicted short-subunit dehydrogenase-like oxidoreductase (DUF2520 family)